MRFDVHKIEKVSARLFEIYGLTKSNAKIAANCLIEAELAGIFTHGISMLPAHIKKLETSYEKDGEIEIEKSTSAFTICNAHNGVGMVTAWKCAELVGEKSSKSGMHMVLCHNANTFSAAYCYAKQMTDNKKIGIICANSPAQMAPLNGVEKLLGTNPLAIGIPAEKEAPFILDMATSAVAKSKINQALHSGDKIPYGWATDIEGNDTDDPQKAVAGLILPMAGAKGYGLSMAIDILSGLLARASFLDNVGRFYTEQNLCMNVGHLFIAIDPAVVYGNDFFDDMDKYLHKIRGSKAVEGKSVFVPGDLNYLSREKGLEYGIEVSNETINEIQMLFNRKGIKAPFVIKEVADV